MSEPRVVTLSNLAEGAADEVWRAALDKVVENIDDPNTDHKSKRRIVLTFDFSCDEERRVGDVTVNCSVKLAAVKSLTTNVYFGRVQGRMCVVEAPRNLDLFEASPAPLRAVETAGGPQ